MSCLHPFRALLLGALVLVAGCDAYLPLEPGRGDFLPSGRYRYDSWTSSGFDAWWGDLDLRVSRGGSIRGSYRLPRQCRDAYGFAVDCFGSVSGRVYADGVVRFDFDEGWLRHDGEVNRYAEVFGYWDSRGVGGYGRGEFELLPY